MQGAKKLSVTSCAESAKRSVLHLLPFPTEALVSANASQQVTSIALRTNRNERSQQIASSLSRARETKPAVPGWPTRCACPTIPTRFGRRTGPGRGGSTRLVVATPPGTGPSSPATPIFGPWQTRRPGPRGTTTSRDQAAELHPRDAPTRFADHPRVRRLHEELTEAIALGHDLGDQDRVRLLLFEQQEDEAGARVDLVPAYRVQSSPEIDLGRTAAMLLAAADYILLTTPAATVELARLFDVYDLGEVLAEVSVGCFDEATGNAAAEYGLNVKVLSEPVEVAMLAETIATEILADVGASRRGHH